MSIQYSHHRPVRMAPNPDSSIRNFKVNQDQSATSISSGPCLNAHKMNKAAGSIKKKFFCFFVFFFTRLYGRSSKERILIKYVNTQMECWYNQQPSAADRAKHLVRMPQNHENWNHTHRQGALFSRVKQFPSCCTSTPLPVWVQTCQGWWAVLFVVKKSFVGRRTAVLLYSCELTSKKTPHPFGLILLQVLQRQFDASSRYLHICL